MTDITREVNLWVSCCQDVWERWFKGLDDGEEKFADVEIALLNGLILSKFDFCINNNLANFYERLIVEYQNDVRDFRSCCTQQKAGNIFCTSKYMTIEENEKTSLKSIDCLGMMLDGKPYLELWINESEFYLEPLEDVRISFTEKD